MTIEQIVELVKAANFTETKSADPAKRMFQRLPSVLVISLSGAWTYYPERATGNQIRSGNTFYMLAELLKTTPAEVPDDKSGLHMV